MINGDRIRQARELRGLTQIEFGKIIGVTQSAVAQIESGGSAPGEQVLQRVVLQTGLPLAFFKQPNSIDFPLGSLLFRARASMTLKERCEARQYARTVFEIAEKMEKHVSRVPLRLPRTDDDPISAAIQTRSSLGLAPDTPIPNLISAVERSGVLVIALSAELEKRDAFSAWVGIGKQRPVIVLTNKSVPGDRLRFTVAHELGHLVMHQAFIGDMASVEKEAGMFASEFLMPKEAMIREISRPVTLASLFSLKLKWKVSVQSLIRRANTLEIITPRQYKYLMQQMSMNGMRTKEPGDIPVEKPRKISQMAELIYGIPINFKKFASDVNLPVNFVKDTIEAHANKNSVKVENRQDKSNGANVLAFKRR